MIGDVRHRTEISYSYIANPQVHHGEGAGVGVEREREKERERE